MESTGKGISRGHIAKLALGLCLIVSVLMCPEIGFHLPAYLASPFLGTVVYGTIGLTWMLMLLAGIGLLGVFRGAGFFVAVAFVYNLISLGSGLSFVPFVPTLLGTLGIRGIAGPIIVHVANLIFVVAVIGAQIATTKPRSKGAEQATNRRLATLFWLDLLSGLAIAVSIGACVTLFLPQELFLARINPLPKYIDSFDSFAGLIILGGPLFVAGVFGVMASCRRLIRMVRFRRKSCENDGESDTGRISETVVCQKRPSFISSLRPVLNGTLAAVIVVVVSVQTWKDTRNPLRYDRQFHAVISWADRLTVRDGGLDCCSPVDNQEVLFEVTDPSELAEVRDHLQFLPEEPAGGCLCCGYPGMDWYRGDRRIALTAVVHGSALRWKAFPADAHLTGESTQWLRQWFERHGFEEKRLKPRRLAAQ